MPTLDALLRGLERPPTALDLPLAARAAVALVFDERLDLLFIRRADVAGDPWSGHISFPGGREEDQDSGLLETARRETLEEVGLDLSAARVLGSLDQVTTISGLPPLVVQPWVLWVQTFGELTLNHEVASVHRVPLDTLLSDQGRSTFQLDFRGTPVTLPQVDVGAGDRFLWGMTLRMIDGLLDRLDGRGIGLARIRSA